MASIFNFKILMNIVMVLTEFIIENKENPLIQKIIMVLCNIFVLYLVFPLNHLKKLKFMILKREFFG